MKVVSLFSPVTPRDAASYEAASRGNFFEGANSYNMDLKQYGYIETEAPAQGLIPGRVTEARRERYTVITEHGEVSAMLKGAYYHAAAAREDFPCVGDFVFLRLNEQGDSQIERLLPRRSKFSRSDFSGHKVEYVKTVLEQVLAANFDYVFILSSLNKDFKVSRIIRYLTQARQSRGEPVVILTKADLAEDAAASVAEVRAAVPGVPVHAVSAHTGAGLEELDRYMQPEKTIIFLGMSGVGKSSLLNALMGREVMAVKAIREDDSRGRHTTTHRQLFMLPCGAMIIDTPGMRELGLYGAEEGIRESFPEVEELLAQCRFSDCRHLSEPGCAIRAALEDGSLPEKQWERYMAQKKEAAFAERRAAKKRK